MNPTREMQMRFLASGHIFSLRKEFNFTAMQCCLFRENIEIAKIAEDTVFISQHHVKTLFVLECIRYFRFPTLFSSTKQLTGSNPYKETMKPHMSGKCLISSACAVAAFFQKASSPSAMSKIA